MSKFYRTIRLVRENVRLHLLQRDQSLAEYRMGKLHEDTHKTVGLRSSQPSSFSAAFAFSASSSLASASSFSSASQSASGRVAGVHLVGHSSGHRDNFLPAQFTMEIGMARRHGHFFGHQYSRRQTDRFRQKTSRENSPLVSPKSLNSRVRPSRPN